jgi:hypothetical protein
MGFNLRAFAGGFASALSEDIEQEEKLATLRGKQGATDMYENYKKVIADNRKIQNELKTNIDIISSYDQSATPAELAALASNKHVMDRLLSRVKEPDFDASQFRVADIVNVAKDNSTSTALERLSSMYTLPVSQPDAPVKRDPSGNLIVDIIKGTGGKAEERAARQTAAALGVTLEELKAAQKVRQAGVNTGATFNMAAFQKQPQNVKDITDKLEVSLVQAAQQFGEDSDEYKKALEQITKVKTTVAGLEDNTDKSVDARAKRLRVQLLDTTDPAKRKQLQADIDAAERSILQHNKATRVTEPKVTYNAMKISVNDYVNTRMKEDKGVDWRQYVDFKTFTDPSTNQVFTSRTQKEKLTPEKQQELFAIERRLTAQALRDNGYVLQDGTPRTPIAEELMRNFNISAADLSTQPSAQTAQSAPATPAAPVVPAAQTAAQPVKPAAAPMPPQLTREDQEALVWANNPDNAGPKAEAIKKKIQNKINGAN